MREHPPKTGPPAEALVEHTVRLMTKSADRLTITRDPAFTERCRGRGGRDVVERSCMNPNEIGTDFERV